MLPVADATMPPDAGWKLVAHPPPCCMVSAPSFSALEMLSRSSGISPMRAVEQRPPGAPLRRRRNAAARRKRKSSRSAVEAFGPLRAFFASAVRSPAPRAASWLGCRPRPRHGSAFQMWREMSMLKDRLSSCGGNGARVRHYLSPCVFLSMVPFGYSRSGFVHVDSSHPYSALTPRRALDALDSTVSRRTAACWPSTATKTASYQMGVRDARRGVKFLPSRTLWSDAAILEEHAFTRPNWPRARFRGGAAAVEGATLHTHAGSFRRVSQAGGRMPEFDRADTLQWMGRFIGASSVGMQANFAPPADIDLERFAMPRHFWRSGHWAAGRSDRRVGQRGRACPSKRRALL